MDNLKEYYRYLRLKKGFSKNTINPYVDILKRFLRSKYSLEDIEDFYFSFLEKSYSSKYLDNIYYALRYYCEMNSRDFKVKKPKVHERRRKSLTKKGAIIFLSVINDKRDRLIVLLGLTTGMRPSEILNLNINDIDLKNDTILVKNTKIFEDRIAYIDDTVKPYIEMYLEKRKKYAKKSKALFITYRAGRRLSLTRLQYLMSEYSKKSGVRCTSYMLRHTFATLYIQNGGDIKILKELMGHKDIKTTERYIHENPEMIREGYKKYVPRF